MPVSTHSVTPAERYRERHPDRVRESRQQWREANRERESEASRQRSRRWRAANPGYDRTRERRDLTPEKRSAHNAVSYAIRTGRLVRQPCEVCGMTDDVQGHHDDYAKPLDVRWLCPLHHARVGIEQVR